MSCVYSKDIRSLWDLLDYYICSKIRLTENVFTLTPALTLTLTLTLCRVYTCRFDNQVPNEKHVKKYYLVVKLAKYFVCEVDRKLASYCKQEI